MYASQSQLDQIITASLTGRVVRTEGNGVAVAGFPAPVGSVVQIERESGCPVEGDVIGFHRDQTLVYPLGDIAGVRHGNRVRLTRTRRMLQVGEQLLGRVVNGHGVPIDGRTRPALMQRRAISNPPPSPTERPAIDTPLSTGIRAIDALLTCGRGQRMGIFSGSGVGKSVLLGMMARNTSADVNVIGLIGERGREVNEFIQRDLGPEGLARSVVVVAPSDQTALVRVHAAMTATAIAEYFRDQGKDVLLMMDSITRFAAAQRELGLAAGEPPTTRGYPPSVFATLPKLLERAGRSGRGSITGFYSVLVEGDDTNEPISDAVRGLLDGHTILSRKLASAGHYPAIDILESISRLTQLVNPPDPLQAARRFRELLATYREHEDLVTVGAYRPGSNASLDVAIAMRDRLNQFLQQSIDERASLETSRVELMQLAQQWNSAGMAANQAQQSPSVEQPVG